MLKPARLFFAVTFLLTGFGLSNINAAELVINEGAYTCGINSSVPVRIDSTTGNVEVAVLDAESCFGPQTAPLAPDLAVEVLQQQAPGSARVTWSSSANATSCSASSTPQLSAWLGDVELGENQVLDIEQLSAGAYTLGLACSNSVGTSPTQQASFSIADTSTPEACSNRPPPSGWERMSTGGLSCVYSASGVLQTGSDCRTWQPGIWGLTFLETAGATRRLGTRQGQNQYLAIQFNTTGLLSSKTGRISSSESGSLNNPRRIWTISECPGDFSPSQPTGCYGQLTSIFHLSWGGTASSSPCKLESNRTYYLNIIPTDSPLGTAPNDLTLSSDCSGRACGAVYDPQNQ